MSAHIVISLVAQLSAAGEGLVLEQGAVGASHADAVVWLQVPASRTLLLGQSSPEEAECEKRQKLHCRYVLGQNKDRLQLDISLWR